MNIKKNPLTVEKSQCQVEAIVSFDERGQLVLPKDVRKKFKLNAGDKFALISCAGPEEFCCFTLIPADKLQTMVKSFLGPVFKEMI